MKICVYILVIPCELNHETLSSFFIFPIHPKISTEYGWYIFILKLSSMINNSIFNTANILFLSDIIFTGIWWETLKGLWSVKIFFFRKIDNVIDAFSIFFLTFFVQSSPIENKKMKWHCMLSFILDMLRVNLKQIFSLNWKATILIKSSN